MRSSHHARQVLSACTAMLLLVSIAHAQVFKWVDAEGRTHYSERKADANGAKTREVKILPTPKAIQTSDSTGDNWREQSQFTQPQPTFTTDSQARPSGAKVPRSISDGIDHGTDESRCALARDVLAGAVRHGNGKPIDKYDREVAQNDVKAFCRSR